ncbi:MAG: hypothetical protein ACI88A_003465 [Paraglaciecola sp.]|jgi:hypothetical protein
MLEHYIVLKKSPFVVGILLVMLTACDAGGAKDQQGAGKFGMLDTNIPEYAAEQFFVHIYNDKDINGALKLSSPRMGRLLQSYRTNRNVQRHVFNMPFDKVEIKQLSGNAGRNEFAKDATVTIFFEGQLDGKILKDLRAVKLLRIDKEWKVDEVSIN